MKNIDIEFCIKFEPRDMWIGLYWNVSKMPFEKVKITMLYFCFIPMLPLIVRITRS